MKTEVFLSPAQVDELQLKDKTVVVIDVLRASTSITRALEQGAREIIPVVSVESAVKISGNLIGEVTLRAGERNSKRIEGFNLGNSPHEYTENVVKGKSIIFLTTNGTGALAKSRYAKHAVVASFVNLQTVVNFLRDQGEDFTILCAGHEGKFSLEDTVCAGKLISRLSRILDQKLTLDDASRAALALEKSYGRNLLKMLKESDHGAILLELGFEDDLGMCAELDSIDVLPMLVGNVVRVSRELNKNVA